MAKWFKKNNHPDLESKLEKLELLLKIETLQNQIATVIGNRGKKDDRNNF